MERSPAERDEDRPCETGRVGLVGELDCTFRDEEMSMLPPPTALRFRRRERRRLRFRDWSTDEGPSGSGVIVSVPSSCAYAYKINSVFAIGKDDEKAVRGGLR